MYLAEILLGQRGGFTLNSHRYDLTDEGAFEYRDAASGGVCWRRELMALECVKILSGKGTGFGGKMLLFGGLEDRLRTDKGEEGGWEE